MEPSSDGPINCVCLMVELRALRMGFSHMWEQDHLNLTLLKAEAEHGGSEGLKEQRGDFQWAALGCNSQFITHTAVRIYFSSRLCSSPGFHFNT